MYPRADRIKGVTHLPATRQWSPIKFFGAPVHSCHGNTRAQRISLTAPCIIHGGNPVSFRDQMWRTSGEERGGTVRLFKPHVVRKISNPFLFFFLRVRNNGLECMTELLVDGALDPMVAAPAPLERDRMIEEPGICQFLSRQRSITYVVMHWLSVKAERGLRARFRVAQIRASKRGSPVARETRPRCRSAIPPAVIHAGGSLTGTYSCTYLTESPLQNSPVNNWQLINAISAYTGSANEHLN